MRSACAILKPPPWCTPERCVVVVRLQVVNAVLVDVVGWVVRHLAAR